MDFLRVCVRFHVIAMGSEHCRMCMYRSHGLIIHSFNTDHTFLMNVDGGDFTGGLYTVQFNQIGRQNTHSSFAEIPILDDFIHESTEYFTCVILRPREDGLIVDCPNTIDIKIEDDDGEYC